MNVVVVAAHPDDEVLGLGAWFRNLKRPYTIIHITDGAPRSGSDARNAGCANWQEYAGLRRRELDAVLNLLGASADSALCLDCPDQEAAFRIPDHADRLARIFERLSPVIVFTHAYEGGHPDHDATAAAVHAAAHLGRAPVSVMEFAGYHAGPAGMECECFLGHRTEVLPRPLSPSERRWKRELLSCYASQQRILAQFPLQSEPLRLAPQYDFALPPHPGTLYYDQFDWGVRAAQWQSLARQAFQDMGISCVC